MAETLRNAVAVTIVGVALSLLFLPKIIHALIAGARAMGAS